MYSIEELKKALENRRACLAYLSDTDGNPKLCANKESFDANKAAVWAIEQAIKRLEDA